MNVALRFGGDQWHYYFVVGEKPREIAARILAQRGSGEFVEALLERALERVSFKPEDRRFVQELVYGTVRWEMTLDWLIEQKTGGKPQKALVQNLLRLALYQMFWLDRVPSYAAVNETVETCKQNGLLPQAKFINAVLRGYGREAEVTQRRIEDFKNSNLSLGFSHPEWLCRKWESRWGRPGAAALLAWNNEPPPTYVRVNTLRTEADALIRLWEAEGAIWEEGEFAWLPPRSLFRLVRHPAFNTMPSFQSGLFYTQDPSTLLAPELLDPQPGETILDICAAPGGKTTYLAQKMRNHGQVLAEDLDPKRLKLVMQNAERLGASSVTTDSSRFGADAKFDRVLIDAPCSNTGVMRRRVELRWRIRPEEIRRLAILQVEILQRASARVRAGGVLVYSTCSLEGEENGTVIKAFLASRPEFRLEDERALTPMENRTDGAYCAKLIEIAKGS